MKQYDVAAVEGFPTRANIHLSAAKLIGSIDEIAVLTALSRAARSTPATSCNK
jgi:hypothetical protein